MHFAVCFDALFCRKIMMTAAAIAMGSLFMNKPAAAQSTSTWTACAQEHELCSFSGTRNVRYGANGTWTVRQVAASGGGVLCTNEVFGDPLRGTLKACELAATGGGAMQQPPTISGTPTTSVSVGSTYRFQPAANDPNGDTLAFSITNGPTWASFNTTNGLLTGQPTLGNVGTYSNIVIRVSDSNSTVTLPGFAINVVQLSSGTARLSWTPPTSNTDGTALTNLSGYNIYYGTSATELTQKIQIANSSASSYVVSDLTGGTYYFAVRAYNTAGAESVSSNQASKTIL
jgi:Putative Ig domain